MPGTRITDQQVCLYMNIRKNKSQELAAAKAGISKRSARRIERSVTLPSQNLPEDVAGQSAAHALDHLSVDVSCHFAADHFSRR